MAHYSGTASSFANLMDTMIALMLTEGWVEVAGVYSKGGIALTFDIGAHYVKIRASVGSDMVTASPTDLLPVLKVPTSGASAGVWPAPYHIFSYGNMFALSLNFRPGIWQTMAFGKCGSDPDKGQFVVAPSSSTAAATPTATGTMSIPASIVSPTGAGANNNIGYSFYERAPIIYKDDAWKMGGFDTAWPMNYNWSKFSLWFASTEMPLNMQVNLLSPIVITDREAGSFKVKSVVENVRLARFLPGDTAAKIVQFGAEEWMLIPQANSNESTFTNGRNGLAFRIS